MDKRFFLAVATHVFPVALISAGHEFEKLINLRQKEENTLRSSLPPAPHTNHTRMRTRGLACHNDTCRASVSDRLSDKPKQNSYKQKLIIMQFFHHLVGRLITYLHDVLKYFNRSSASHHKLFENIVRRPLVSGKYFNNRTSFPVPSSNGMAATKLRLQHLQRLPYKTK